MANEFNFQVLKVGQFKKGKLTGKANSESLVKGDVFSPEGSICFSSKYSNTVFFTGNFFPFYELYFLHNTQTFKYFKFRKYEIFSYFRKFFI